MTEKLRLFVCEFITGGGLYNAPLPASLAREGDAMLGALLRDLCDLPHVEVTTTRDSRLPALEFPVQVEMVEGEPWPQWQRCIADADAFWPIAPETDGLLQRLSQMAGSVRLIGPSPESVHLAASKRRTAECLAAAGIAVVPTFSWVNFVPGPGRFVAKPDDGVGCEGIRVFEDIEDALAAWMPGRAATHVVQPWLPGEAASLSMICANGRAQLLSCNRQLISVRDGEIRYSGSVLNGFSNHWPAFADLASRIAARVPGLAGYVGVDLMVNGDQLTVLEINPRLTTSYVGLRAATGRNPAGLVLDLLYNGCMADSSCIQRNPVEVKLDG